MSYNTTKHPRCYRTNVGPGSTELITFPGVVHFCQIVMAQENGGALTVKLNEDENAVFEMDPEINPVQIFNNGDVHLTSIRFTCWQSGVDADIMMIVGYTA